MLKKTTPFTLSSLIIALLLSTSSSHADTTLNYSDSIDGKVNQTTEIHIKGHRVRSQNHDSPIYTLYDAKQNTLYSINEKDKTYSQTELSIVQEMANKAAQQQQKMRQTFLQDVQKLPPEQRQLMQERLAVFEQQLQKPAPKVSTLKTGKTLTVKQLECDVYLIDIDGKASRESCINKEVIEQPDLESLQSMFKFINQVAQYQAQIQGQKAPDLSKLPSYSQGLALSIKSLTNGVKSELSSISKDAIEKEELFVIPADYKKL